MSAGSSDSWKQKYYDSLAELEAEQKRFAETEAVLRRAISRLALAADGVDPALDRQLDRVRELVRKNQGHMALDAVIEDIGQTVQALEARRKQTGRKLSPVDILDTILAGTRWPRGMGRRARELRDRLDADPGTLGQLTGELVTLITDALQWVAGEQNGEAAAGTAGRRESRESGASEAVLDQLRVLLTEVLTAAPATAALNTAPLRARLRSGRNAAELIAVARDLGALMAPAAAPAPAAVGSPADLQDKAPGIALVLAQLLDTLSVPPELSAQATALRDRLSAAGPRVDWSGELKAIAGLVAAMRLRVEREKAELEEFLRQLTERLHELGEHVLGAEAYRRASYDSGRQLDDAVSAEMHGIESSVRAAASLDQLQHAIRERVDTIRAQLDRHRRTEAERQTELEARLQATTRRLKQVEQETETLRADLHQRQAQAMQDVLTGIPNRLAYEERLAQEYARFDRYRTPLALLVLDVDHFKRLNDSLGHKAGDKALASIAQVLCKQLRSTDFLARYGGEEFVVLLPETPADQAAAVAEKLRAAIESCEFHYTGKRVPVTLSVGYALFREFDTSEQVFQRADAALYVAKGAGRNCVKGG